ncbi:hypothetical protein ABZZ20_00715 [Streptomyces sp. NPDC006430]|uniref:CurL C-terminal domain-containing protein n=1 Tax=Streptomyces sp. NPDC006430 TaxID=3154299 RepID=UPI0033B7D9F7
MSTTFLEGAGAPRVLAVSARDEDAVAAVCQRLAERLEGDPALGPDDVAVTLAHGRERFAVRRAVTGRDRAELAAALREAARDPRPTEAAGALVLDLGDGSAVTDGTPDLPQVAEAVAQAEALQLPPGSDRSAARTAAVLHGTGVWLAARGLRPLAVRGQGPGAAAAAALHGALTLPDALRAAADRTTVPAAPEPGRSVSVVRLTAPRSAAPDAPSALPGGLAGTGLCLDPLDPHSYAHLFAALWERGVDVDCSLDRGGRRVRLPGYPFRRSGEVTGPVSGLRPLTPHEQRWLFHDLVRRGSAAEHTLCATAVLPGPLPEPRAAETALAALQQRHPALRTVFTQHGGRWFARTSPAPAPVTHLGRDQRNEVLAQVRAATVEASFAAADAPLVRCALAPTGDGWAVALAVYAPVAGSSSADELLAEWVELAGSSLRPAAATL